MPFLIHTHIQKCKYKLKKIHIYIYIYGWRTPHFMGRYSAFLAFLPNFIVKKATTYSHWKVAVNLFFSFLVFLFFCLFLRYFSLFLCFYKSQSLKIAHQLRCAAKWLYIKNICGEVIIRAKFGLFRGYHLGQVGVIILAKVIFSVFYSGLKRFLHIQLPFCIFSSIIRQFCKSSVFFSSAKIASFEFPCWSLIKKLSFDFAKALYNRLLAFFLCLLLLFKENKKAKTKLITGFFRATSLGPKPCLFCLLVFVFLFVFPFLASRRREPVSSKKAFLLVSQCLPLFCLCFFLTPLFTLSLSLLFLCFCFFLFFLPSFFAFFLSFFSASFLFCLSFLPCFFAFTSWKEQVQNIRLERFLSSILSVLFGFLSCFVFQIPFFLSLFSYLKLWFLFNIKGIFYVSNDKL